MAEKNQKDSVSYILNILGEERSRYYQSMAPPVIQTSNFRLERVEDFAGVIDDEYSSYVYSRGRNPTVDILKSKLAALDGAEDCLVVNSGSTAIFIAVLSQVKAGDHIVAVKGVYSWAQKLFEDFLPRFNVETTWIDGTAMANFERALRPNTRLIYLESPTSWFFEEQDVRAVASLANAHGIVTVIDNTYYTPLYQRPLEMGVTISIQSASKYIGGHSDVVAGVICAGSEVIRKMFLNEFLNVGAGIMPFNAWLMLRGLRTLPLRLEKIRRSTPPVLDFLRGHDAVEEILAPVDVFGLFTIVLRPVPRAQIVRFCESLQHIAMAVSWGGHESLIMPRCAGVPDNEYDVADASHRAVRLYIGLEDPEFLIADLRQAMSGLG